MGHKNWKSDVCSFRSTVNLNNIVLWDTKTGSPIHKFSGNASKTYATLSPDGKYVVSGDENENLFLWSSKTGKKLWDGYSLKFGKYTKTGPGIKDYKFDAKGLIKQPTNFYEYSGNNADDVISIKFIDLKGDFITLLHNIPYAVLYNIKDPKPIKYLYLGDNPMPAVTDYSRDQAIDTAPSAHILVMGKACGNGILVYKFDPKTKTLNKVWNAS